LARRTNVLTAQIVRVGRRKRVMKEKMMDDEMMSEEKSDKGGWKDQLISALMGAMHDRIVFGTKANKGAVEEAAGEEYKAEPKGFKDAAKK
jgi:hypothetical protein